MKPLRLFLPCNAWHPTLHRQAWFLTTLSLSLSRRLIQRKSFVCACGLTFVVRDWFDSLGHDIVAGVGPKNIPELLLNFSSQCILVISLVMNTLVMNGIETWVLRLSVKKGSIYQANCLRISLIVAYCLGIYGLNSLWQVHGQFVVGRSAAGCSSTWAFSSLRVVAAVAPSFFVYHSWLLVPIMLSFWVPTKRYEQFTISFSACKHPLAVGGA